MTQMGRQKLAMDVAADIVTDLAEFPLVQVDKKIVLLAMQRHQSKAFSFSDSLIVEAALRSGCSALLSEDMHHGLSIGPLTIVNPFAN